MAKSKANVKENGTEKTAVTLHDWQLALTLIDDIRERDVEAFETAQTRIPHIILSGTNSNLRAYLCAAIEAEWITSPECKALTEKGSSENSETTEKSTYFYDGRDVEEMHPGAVRWLGMQILLTYNEAISVPLALS